MKRLVFLAPLLNFSLIFAQEEIAAKPKDTTKTYSSKSSSAGANSDWMRGDDPLMAAPLMSTASAAYSYPANISVNRDWDLYADVSYLYWYSKQEGLSLGSLGYDFDTGAWLPGSEGKVYFQNGKYTSGFKIGLGANLNVDDWVADLTYSYYRQKTFTHTGDAPVTSGQPGVFNISSWYPITLVGGPSVARSVTSKWKMHLDWLDLQFYRPYYQGSRLIVTPSAGLRASWIRQQFQLKAEDAYNVYAGAPKTSNVTGIKFSNSWALGPRGVLGASWLLWEGLRIQGAMGASLLFTQYGRISTQTSNIALISSIVGGTKLVESNYNCLRTMAEANLGIGWGSYFCGNRYHVDLSATYDFNYLWSQNMIQYLSGADFVFGNNNSPGDLILHGLDIKARFDF